MSLFSFDQIHECCIICLCGEAGMVMSGVCSVYIRSLSTALVSREKWLNSWSSWNGCVTSFLCLHQIYQHCSSFQKAVTWSGWNGCVKSFLCLHQIYQIYQHCSSFQRAVTWSGWNGCVTSFLCLHQIYMTWSGWNGCVTSFLCLHQIYQHCSSFQRAVTWSGWNGCVVSLFLWLDLWKLHQILAGFISDLSTLC